METMNRGPATASDVPAAGLTPTVTVNRLPARRFRIRTVTKHARPARGFRENPCAGANRVAINGRSAAAA
ncbi:hypothetical protein CJU94_31540 [Paraburkholderia aromaticivorans]|uniref:Uncharacterized protein n=1 Tax=Paraburkholderia aromaticivorans TaxID=2026199 RepID=A0A248VU70_9BURK|nr:hypothetical protein CJU94_31540 [Paraburkholderia aromaticivorans]